MPIPLRQRDFRLFWTAETTSRIGFWLQTVGQSWLVWHLSHSTMTVALVAAIQLLPALLLAPVGGLLADRLPQRQLLLATQGGLSLTALVLWALASAGSPTEIVFAVAVAAAVSGLLTAIDTPTRLALIPNLVPREMIGQAVAVDTTGATIARLVGPALAAGLLSTAGAGTCFLANALSYLPVIVVLPGLTVKEGGRRATAVASVSRELSEGFGFALRTSGIRVPLLVLAVFVILTMNAQTLLPAIADRVLRAGPGGLGLLLAAQGGGAFAGTLARGWLGSSSGSTARGDIVLPVAVGSACLVGFSMTHMLSLALAMMLIAGIAQSQLIVGVQRALQTAAPEHLRGRVMALYSQVLLAGIPLAALLAGGVAHATSAPVAMGGEAAAAAVLLSALVYLPPRFLLRWQVSAQRADQT